MVATPLPATPLVVATPGPTTTAAVVAAVASPVLVPTAAAGVGEAPPRRLDVLWQRLRDLHFVPALETLQILPATERDDSFFGVADALAAEDATPPIMRGVGAAMDRVEVRWDAVEPEPGVFQFDQLDALLRNAQTLHFDVLAVVDGTPAWAGVDKQAAGAAVPRGLDAPARLLDGRPNPANPWAGFLAVLDARYGTQIAAWEVWNEPNSQEFWHGSPTEYARLYAVAREVLTRTAPRSSVLTGGLVSDDGGFLRTVAATLCPSDPCVLSPPAAVAWHVYNNPTDIGRLADLTRTTLRAYGLDPEIWITEANVPVDDPQAPGDAVVGPDAVSLNRQAAFVLQAYVLARAAGVRSLAIYRAGDVDDNGHYWGLLRADGTARPALLAYRTAAEWLSHTRPAGLQQPQPGVTLASFCRDDATMYAFWNDGPQPATISLPADAATARLVQTDGSTTGLTATGGKYRVTLPAAAARTPAALPLGEPRLLAERGTRCRS